MFGEKLYVSPILDLHSGDLISRTISKRPVLNMVTSMLDKAFDTIPDKANLILRSDQVQGINTSNANEYLQKMEVGKA